MPSPDFLALLAPGNIVAVVIVVAMLAYTLTGGADFGGGVLDLLATGPRAGAQRRSIARAIGPIWEARRPSICRCCSCSPASPCADRRSFSVHMARTARNGADGG
ncbi:MAG: hypothetical protein EBT47_05690 [Chloroflexi bacterium]|nr:hypothetical protein [Chloroflexota bacterium]